VGLVRPRTEGWSETAYADPRRYLGRRARLTVGLGTPLEPGDLVLDLACGDGAFAEHLLPYGLEFLGVDASEVMVASARSRLGLWVPKTGVG
jgi:ubiquinone/menaquinone biosynthesis C-methylase UbiE